MKKYKAHAATDVTGFGLLGHLTEMAEGANLSAVIYFENIQTITDGLQEYINQKAVPGGSQRNWDSYGNNISIPDHDSFKKLLLSDPQTSGGLLIAVDKNYLEEVYGILKSHQLEQFCTPIGKITSKQEFAVEVI